MTRRIHSDANGNVDPFRYEDDEICVVLSDAARVGLLKLIGSTSRDSLLALKLTEQEIEAIDGLHSVHLN